MRLHGFSQLERSEVIIDIVVSTEVWNRVVDLVTKWLLLVLVLGATGGRADWVGNDISINIRVDLNEGWQLLRCPSVLCLVVSILVSIDCWENPSTVAISLNVPSSISLLSIGNVLLGESDVLIFTEVRNEVVSLRRVWRVSV